MAASLLTWSGASVGVSISTQRRMRSRTRWVSKGRADAVSMCGLCLQTSRVLARSIRFIAPLFGRAMPKPVVSRFETEASASALVRNFLGSDLLDKIDDAAPKLGVADARKGAGQRQAFGRREEIGHIGWRSALGAAVGFRDAARAAFEQKRYRHLEYFGDLLNAACADAIGPLLVLLHLLESEAERFAEFFLAHAEHDATHAHATADIFVNRVGRFGRHRQRSSRPRSVQENGGIMP